MNKTKESIITELLKPFIYEKYGKVYLGNKEDGLALRAEGLILALEKSLEEYADWKIKEVANNSHCDVICRCGEVHTFEKYLRQILSNKDKK